jgi:hypothetical protein
MRYSTICLRELRKPITVAAQSKAWPVFARSNTGVAGSNPTGGMDVCLRLFCVCACSSLATGWSPVQGVLLTVLGLRNWGETKLFTAALCSKVGATGKRERTEKNNNNNGAIWDLMAVIQKMEAAVSAETLVPIYQNIQCRLLPRRRRQQVLPKRW